MLSSLSLMRPVNRLKRFHVKFFTYNLLFERKNRKNATFLPDCSAVTQGAEFLS